MSRPYTKGTLPDRAPDVRVEVVEDVTSGVKPGEGFLNVRHLVLRNRGEGAATRPYRYSFVEREAMDAVAIVLEADDAGRPLVCLRSAVRPPIALRGEPASAGLWEVPAGLIEPDERGDELGFRRCAARETLEETGALVAPLAFETLGPPLFLTPGVIGERVHFFAARVELASIGAPTEDGSVLEEGAEVRFVPFDDARTALADGRIADIKTEVAIRRLLERRGWR